MPQSETSEQLRSRQSRSYQDLKDAIEMIEGVNALGIVKVSPSTMGTLRRKMKSARAHVKFRS